jgi:hypothetical protein
MGLALAALDARPALAALQLSARHVEHCLRGIQVTSNSLSPVERLVFGLVSANSANTDAAPQPRAQGASAAPRT